MNSDSDDYEGFIAVQVGESKRSFLSKSLQHMKTGSRILKDVTGHVLKLHPSDAPCGTSSEILSRTSKDSTFVIQTASLPSDEEMIDEQKPQSLKRRKREKNISQETNPSAIPLTLDRNQQTCEKLRKGVQVLHDLSKLFAEEESIVEDENVSNNSRASEVSVVESEDSHQEGTLQIFCSTCSSINGIQVDHVMLDSVESISLFKIDAHHVEGTLVNIRCCCGNYFEIMITDEKVCFPVPFLSEEGVAKHCVPKSIWGQKRDNIQGGLECLSCGSKISLVKIGESVRYKVTQ